jgi:hypothetical protein
MLKTNLLVFTFGIVVGGTLQYLTVNSVKGDMGAISSSLESKLNGISQQLSESRCINQQMKLAASGEACNQSASSEESLADLKQSVQWAVEDSVRPIIQEELEFLVSQLPQDKEVVVQPEQTADLQMDAENMARAEQVLAKAIGDGIWTQQDMDAFNGALSNMSDEARAEASRKFAVAINNGDIEYGDDMPLF